MSCFYNYLPGPTRTYVLSWSRSTRQLATARPWRPAHALSVDLRRERAARPIDHGDLAMKRISLLTVFVKDQDAAIEFYRDKLGFNVVEDVPFGKQRWVTVRLPNDETVSITLAIPESEADRGLIGRQAGAQPMFGSLTDDCMAE